MNNNTKHPDIKSITKDFNVFPHSVTDAIFRSDLDAYTLRVFLMIARQTYGFNSEFDEISLSQFTGQLKMSKNRVLKSIAYLENKSEDILVYRYVALDSGRERNLYFMNTHTAHNIYAALETGEITPRQLKYYKKLWAGENINTRKKLRAEERKKSTLGSSPDELGVVHDMNRGSSPDEHTKETPLNKKEESKVLKDPLSIFGNEPPMLDGYLEDSSELPLGVGNQSELSKIGKSLSKDAFEEEKLPRGAKRATSKFITESFSNCWKSYPNKKGKEKSLDYFTRRLQKSESPEAEYKKILLGVRLYHLECLWNDTEKSKIKHGSTFFHKAHWEDEFNLPANAENVLSKYMDAHKDFNPNAIAELLKGQQTGLVVAGLDQKDQSVRLTATESKVAMMMAEAHGKYYSTVAKRLLQEKANFISNPEALKQRDVGLYNFFMDSEAYLENLLNAQI